MSGELTITVYSKPVGCMACKNTKRKLDDEGVPYVDLDITADTPEAQDALALAEKLHIKEAPLVVVGPPSTTPLVDRQDITVWSGYRSDLIEHFAPRLRPAAEVAEVTGAEAEAEAA